MILQFNGNDFGISNGFIRYLAWRYLGDDAYNVNWHDQISESSFKQRIDQKSQQEDQELLRKVLNSHNSKIRVERAYEIFCSLLTGRIYEIYELAEIPPIKWIVGLPRSGGTYITKGYCHDVGLPYKELPAALLHDGFPNYIPTAYWFNKNTDMLFYMDMAQFIVMLHDFTRDLDLEYFPKKLCNLPMKYHVFEQLFPLSEYVITTRDLEGFLGSMGDKKGFKHLKNRKWKPRLVIEWWAEQQLAASNLAVDDFRKALEIYYHKYHSIISISGIASNPKTKIVKFGKGMEKLFKDFDEEFHIVESKCKV